MNGVIRASLNNPYAVTVSVLSIVLIGSLILAFGWIPVDILPVFKSPAVQVLTFYNGMPADSIEKDITNRMERWTGQSSGMKLQESRSLIGCSIIRNYYRDEIDPNGALTEVNSLASAAIPNLPPGTLPPVILKFDPTGTTPVCIIALDSETADESTLYDIGRYYVRNMIMSNPGAVAPVVYGGKVRAIIAYLDRCKLQARNLSPVQVMDALDLFNIFLPTGDAKFGTTDYAINSNSMYERVQRMRDIPIKMENGKPIFLGDVADPQDAAMIQTNIVRVNGRRQVYIPIFRQVGSSTLSVVNALEENLPSMKERLPRNDIDLKLVMDQSVYVKSSITSLMWEGILGAILCSLVILLFLGEWRMTLIAVLTIPVSVLAAIIALYFTGKSINVMTLAGLSLAIGPLVDSAIICLENTHRHLSMGTNPREAAFLGASEVAMPELVASCCTLLVLAPLALMPGLGAFLFRPMALAVAFAMILAYLLSRSFVPTRCALWLRPHDIAHDPGAPVRRGLLSRGFAKWEAMIEAGIRVYVVLLRRAMRMRVAVLAVALLLFLGVVLGLGYQLRREFFPEVDAGAFEMYVRAPTGTRIDLTEKEIVKVEQAVRDTVGEDLETLISEIGVVADWSAAYTPNSGPMDTVVKVQLKETREESAQEYVHRLRTKFAEDPAYRNLEFAFDAGGMIRSAMNEGKSTPINIRITAKDLSVAHQIAANIQREARGINGVVDCRIMQRLDYPQYTINIDRTKAADVGLTQTDIMKNVVASVNNSIQFNKRNFWIDPFTHNQYFVGVQYPEQQITSLDTLMDIPITSQKQLNPVPLRNLATLDRDTVPAEVTHTNLQATIDLTMSVHGRDLGHISDDVASLINKFGQHVKKERKWMPKWLPESFRFAEQKSEWVPNDPAKPGQTLGGSQITLSGEYSKMQDTFTNLAVGLALASVLIYFLMVALFKSWLTPLVVMSAVPIGLVGVVLILFLTGTALNVQSLLGMIFMVGIVVSNTVLLTDFTQHIRMQEGLSPTAAVTKAASIRVRPVVMTALAAFFALLPMALGLERGSEANTPLGRAVIGGLLAGLVTTLFVVPCLYSLVVRDHPPAAEGVAASGSHPDVPPHQAITARPH
jgi:multidrug efflux pump subunit AcrB